MVKAEIVTSWTGNGTFDNSYRPTLVDNYTIDKFEDVTRQSSDNFPLTQNLYIICIECSQTELELIAEDANYCILWSEAIEVAE